MKDTLIQWQGGGYDGCFWEPNTGLYDSDGVWHPIISTGRGARPEPVIDEEDDVYPITKDGLKEFRDNIRDDFFLRTLQVLEQHGYTPYWECDICKHVFDDTSDFCNFESYCGDGGIGVIHEGMICYDCHSDGSCYYCGEFQGESNLEAGFCEYCMERACEDVQDEIDELESDIEHVKRQASEYAKVVPSCAIKGYRDAIKISRELKAKIYDLKLAAVESL